MAPSSSNSFSHLAPVLRMQKRRLIITNPLERFLIKNYFKYDPDEGILQIAPQLWKELRHYEMLDVLKSADEQITYYYSRSAPKEEQFA